MKQKDARVTLFAVEPAEAPILTHRKWGTHRIQGIEDRFVPRNFDLSHLSGMMTSTSDESIEMARRLSEDEGIFCGISSGCKVVAGIKVARKHPEFRTIVMMINDTGQRYFSTILCGKKSKLRFPKEIILWTITLSNN